MATAFFLTFTHTTYFVAVSKQLLRKITDLTRIISVGILCLHFYISCYAAFEGWGLVSGLPDRFITILTKTGLFDSSLKPKWASLLMLAISLIGVKSRKDERSRIKLALLAITIGVFLYLTSVIIFRFYLEAELMFIFYISLTSAGYLLMLSGAVRLTRHIKDSMAKDIFNSENETFPQKERLL